MVNVEEGRLMIVKLMVIVVIEEAYTFAIHNRLIMVSSTFVVTIVFFRGKVKYISLLEVTCIIVFLRVKGNITGHSCWS